MIAVENREDLHLSENLQTFLEMASKDESICARVNAANQEELIAIAKELGVELAKEDFAACTTELDDDELKTVSGGSDVNCVCAMGGGGTKDDNDKTCACVLAGVGYTDEKSERCLCGFAGYGYDT